MKITHYLPLLLIPAALATGCLKQETNPDKGKTTTESEGYFDFATTGKHTLTVDYDLAAAGYTTEILFEVYAEDPYTVSSADGAISVVRSGAKPVAKGITQNHGHFSGTVQLPSWADKVWVCTDYPGVPGYVMREVGASAINVDMSKTTAVASAQHLVTRGGANHAYPADMYPIDDRDDWDAYGKPSYLNPGGSSKTVPAGLLADIRGVLPEAKDLTKADNPHSYLVQPNVSHDIRIKSATTIDMTFINDGAVLTSVSGYYVYPTNNPPKTPYEITKKYIAFPNASAQGSHGKLVPGDFVHLKYIDDQGVWTDQFEAGMSIGFFIFVHGFDGIEKHWGDPGTGDIREMHWSNYQIHYSNPALNYYYWHNEPVWAGWQKQQTVALYDYKAGGRDLVVIGFEDMSNGGHNPSGDRDFNDVMFYIQATPADGIEVPDGRDPDLDPNPDPAPESYVVDYEGTLAFEDLWPNKGDYDMNDVGVEYFCQVHYDKNNKVTKVVDMFRPVHKGAQFENGFGYQYGVAPSAVKSVNWSVSPDKARPWYTTDVKGLEAGQSLATVMLFDNGRTEVAGSDLDYVGGQQTPLYTYAITTEFTSPQNIEAVGFPPYNPFIVVKHAASGDVVDPRNREVHLPCYAPTDLARDKDGGLWFGHYSDRSDKVDKWYVSYEDFPFAINIPKRNFRFPNERVRIDEVYPKFANWVRTRGAEDADWYNHK